MPQKCPAVSAALADPTFEVDHQRTFSIQKGVQLRVDDRTARLARACVPAAAHEHARIDVELAHKIGPVAVTEERQLERRVGGKS